MVPWQCNASKAQGVPEGSQGCEEMEAVESCACPQRPPWSRAGCSGPSMLLRGWVFLP